APVHRIRPRPVAARSPRFNSVFRGAGPASRPPRRPRIKQGGVNGAGNSELTSPRINAAAVALPERSAEDLSRHSAVSVRRALESAGVVFIDENEGGSRVRLRAPALSKSR